MNLFFDLDGTLLNSHKRLYFLFQHLVPDSNLTFQEYWTLKRNKVNHQEILTKQFNYSKEDYQKFEDHWMDEIEKEKWLNLDEPFDGVSAFLQKLKPQNKIYLVTARQSKKMVKKQLARYGWHKIFDTIFVTEHKQDKFSLINENVQVSHDDWFIGDTGMDIEVGKKLGIKTAAVLTGFLNQEKLASYQPDLILANVTLFQLN
jgi:phosphoglycolate phosphatase